MMKRIVMTLLVLAVISVPVYAHYNIDTSNVDKALKGEYGSYIGNQTTENADLRGGVSALLGNSLNIARQKIKDSCRVCFAIIVCCGMTSFVKSFSAVSGSKIAVKVTDYTGVLSIVCIALSSVGGMLSKCTEAIRDISTFSKIVTPVYALAAAVSKHPSTAITTAGATLMFTNIFTALTLRLFIPLIVMYIAAGAVGAVSEINILSRLCELIKWFLSFCWKALLVAFIGYISLSGFISAGTDAVALKTTRMVINSVIPVVGNIIADASDAILSGAVIIKNSVGIIGFLGVCAICLVPFVGCLIFRIVFSITSAVSSSLSGGAMTKVLDTVGSAYGLALAALGTCSMVQFV
ncbi:MAG: stage III sporulation protein AE, partial [Clostridia bacterium]|nr:stage III sporulation protein AE [Clostridia bacterium]